jgi:uncharacterized protein with HEPN domain
LKSDRPYLGHILDSIEAIDAYVSPGRERFMQERMIQDAVIRNFEISARPPIGSRLRPVRPRLRLGAGSSRFETG